MKWRYTMKPLRFFVSLLSFVLPLVLWAQEVPLFTSDFPPEEFAQRRTKIHDAIGQNSIALIQGAPAPVGYVRFRQSNEFYYLCGVEVQHTYLLIDGSSRRTALYLPHRNEGRERSEGKVLSAEDVDEVKQLTGVDAVFGTDLLGEHLSRFARSATIRSVYTLF